MKNMLINEDFEKSIKKLRGILPVLSFTLLIITYIISAIIMGIFHAQKAESLGFLIAAFLVPLAILLAGLGVWAFGWAVRSGQFDDTQTPAIRILLEEDER